MIEESPACAAILSFIDEGYDELVVRRIWERAMRAEQRAGTIQVSRAEHFIDGMYHNSLGRMVADIKSGLDPELAICISHSDEAACERVAESICKLLAQENNDE